MDNQNGGDLGNQWLAGHWAGAGPYRLVMWRPNEYYALEANPAYWGEAPKTRRIIVRDIKESSTQRLLLEKGDVDYARDLDKDQIEALGKNPDIKFDKGVKSSIAYLGLNQTNADLNKPEVVEALKYLVDYTTITDAILGGTAVVHQGFEPIGFLGAIGDAPFGYDVGKAKGASGESGPSRWFQRDDGCSQRLALARSGAGAAGGLGARRHQA